ncbi:UNKNOWN [Stylonychia lemnae]|uniref:Uncharacterized protein n=1 Tax=Stylonychia lemnae TaxID=5949 RepID=A0A077ZZI3_STYLE|nr:UNKNOWN [Stylonychia lemnae]|eukprot:CDW75012.1 UNKNOWN [Stylonychia lemnae]
MTVAGFLVFLIIKTYSIIFGNQFQTSTNLTRFIPISLNLSLNTASLFYYIERNSPNPDSYFYQAYNKYIESLVFHYQIQAFVLLMTLTVYFRQQYEHSKTQIWSEFEFTTRQIKAHDYFERRVAIFSLNGLILFSSSICYCLWAIFYLKPAIYKLYDIKPDLNLTYAVKYAFWHAKIQMIAFIYLLILFTIAFFMKIIPILCYLLCPHAYGKFRMRLSRMRHGRYQLRSQQPYRRFEN